MAFFGFGKKIQLLLIMGALASAPGCYSSNSGSDDVSAEDPAADQSHDDGIDVFYDQDVVQELMDPDVHIDPPPWPMCTEVETSSLTVFQTAGRFTDHADGNVTLNLPSYYVLSCNLPTPCVSAVVEGSGAITQLDQFSQTSAMFRYENEAMGFGEIVPVHFSWRVTCTDTAGAQSEETAGATIYACRDEMSGMLQIVSTYDECIPVVDPPPPPTALNRGGTRIASRIMAGGRIMLSLPQGRDAAKEVIWNASAGSLEILSPLKVLFTPARDQKIQVVQAAVVTPRSVTIELYRYRA
jgi:hypothetical protein